MTLPIRNYANYVVGFLKTEEEWAIEVVVKK
jgi:hypothetical protein